MIDLNGAEQLAAIAYRLEQLGDRKLKRRVYARLTKAMRPARDAAAKSLVETFPKGGGLAEQKRRQVRFRVQRKATLDREVGIRLRAVGGQIRRADREGQFRHPVFGHEPWRPQKIDAGWFTRPTEAQAPAIRTELAAVLDEVAKELDRQ